MFAHSIGIAPFKDNFWTTKSQTGNVYSTYPSLFVLTPAYVYQECHGHVSEDSENDHQMFGYNLYIDGALFL